jgi:pimeloyl-ACP methyl ester carboxylesterase
VRRFTFTIVATLLVGALALPAAAAQLPAFDAALAWTDCGDGFECATLEVPVDWKFPAGERVGIALTRHPATSPSERIGSLVVNYGGPGESGVDILRNTWRRLPAVVQARFDVVSFDPRGTGASRPIDCVDDGLLDLSAGVPAVPDSPERLDTLHRYNAQFAAGCTERVGSYARHVGTRNVARDLEAIRLALGEVKLDYLGYSYGTIVGVTYAQMFPSTIRSMVLDGPPDYWLTARDYAYQQARGFMTALGAFLDWCAQTNCPLAATGAPRDALTELIGRVDQQPLPASYTLEGVTREGVLTPSMLQSGVFAMLYDRSRGWPILADALAEAVQQGRGGGLLTIADRYLGRHPDGTWEPLVEANAVINCVDRPTRKVPTAAAELADVARFQAELPPWGGSWGTTSCVGMPKPAKGGRLGAVSVTGAPPILVIGTTGDPATPYAGAEAMVERIPGSHLLTFDSTEHTAFGRAISACIDDTVDAYLTDGALPAPGARCAPD